ncbi:uncharacterized protein ALTATR162_LOCUS9504 [Alternaria atra]|uniref:Uncharacterized protein n=1 Tax=Alternaria atra TaxID=119953 RepID=A0A8J2I7R2_9PLEO|nr:uncharacterized protein ALTATR162_LOCUS9504 [Alternaria atra]CAG5180922.1 unnamed protein product [Alternaria atra]
MGFYVYGIYMRPQQQKDSYKKKDEGKAQEISLDKLYVHAADTLRYEQPEPYNQELIDTLRLQSAAYLPGASLSDIYGHFRKNAGSLLGAGGELIEEGHNCGSKTDWCLITNDELLNSIENRSEPIVPMSLEGAMPWTLTRNASKVFVKLFSKDEFTTTELRVLAAQGQTGPGQRTEWHGWCKFSPVHLMSVFNETDKGDVVSHAKRFHEPKLCY